MEIIKNEGLRVINISKLSEKDLAFLTQLGLKLDYVESILHPVEIGKDWQIYRRNYHRICRAIKYQDSILPKGSLQVVSPFSGNLISSNTCFAPKLNQYHSYIFRFIEESRVFYLISGDFWSEKVGVYFPEFSLVFCSFIPPKSLEVVVNDLISHLKRNAPRLKSYLSVVDRQPVMILYHSHFAHHALNELSAIQNLIELDQLRYLDKIYVSSEPISKLEKLFPELEEHQVSIVRMPYYEALNSIFKHKEFLIPHRSCKIQDGLVERILQDSRAFLSSQGYDFEFLEGFASTDIKKVWFTIRVGGRTWTNLIQGYINIINSIWNSYPELVLIFDGFSFPRNSNKFENDNYTELIKREQAVLSAILSGINENIQHVNLIGKSIDESFIWATTSDIYICHHGTIQHKVGWFSNCNGIVHTNSLISSKPAESRQGSYDRENNFIPYYLDPEKINTDQNNVTIRTGQKRGGEHSNYDFDWKEIIDLINTNNLLGNENIRPV